MSGYKSYTHVVRLNAPEAEGLLDNNRVAVTAKVDGTNACVYWDTDLNRVGGGSRKRALTENKDNASFYAWLCSGQKEAVQLRRFIEAYPQMIIYGEWLGDSKFVGSIKTYSHFALGHMYIFDVFNIDTKEYMQELEWRDLLTLYGLDPWFVELFGVFDHPTYDDIVAIAENNHFLFPDNETKGEGVVCKAQGWKNKYGHTCYGKIVLAEFHERKYAEKKKANAQAADIEKDIVDYFITESELAKAREKTVVHFNEDFKIEGKFISYYFNELWNSLLDEIPYILKKYQMPVINFRILRTEVQNTGKRFLGLI